MNKWFPELDDMVLDVHKRNEDWLHSVWLGVWLPVSNMPAILCATLGQGLFELLKGIGQFIGVMITPMVAGMLGMVTVRTVAKPRGPEL